MSISSNNLRFISIYSSNSERLIYISNTITLDGKETNKLADKYQTHINSLMDKGSISFSTILISLAAQEYDFNEINSRLPSYLMLLNTKDLLSIEKSKESITRILNSHFEGSLYFSLYGCLDYYDYALLITGVDYAICKNIQYELDKVFSIQVFSLNSSQNFSCEDGKIYITAPLFKSEEQSLVESKLDKIISDEAQLAIKCIISKIENNDNSINHLMLMKIINYISMAKCNIKGLLASYSSVDLALPLMPAFISCCKAINEAFSNSNLEYNKSKIDYAVNMLWEVSRYIPNSKLITEPLGHVSLHNSSLGIHSKFAVLYAYITLLVENHLVSLENMPPMEKPHAHNSIKERYSFIITSIGFGRDMEIVQLPCHHDQSNKVAAISVSTFLQYQIPAACAKLCHETCHYAGNLVRRRQIRAKNIISFLSFYWVERAICNSNIFSNGYKYIIDLISHKLSDYIFEKINSIYFNNCHSEFLLNDVLAALRSIDYGLLFADEESNLDNFVESVFNSNEEIVSESVNTPILIPKNKFAFLRTATYEVIKELRKIKELYPEELVPTFSFFDDVILAFSESYSDLCMIKMLDLNHNQYNKLFEGIGELFEVSFLQLYLRRTAIEQLNEWEVSPKTTEEIKKIICSYTANLQTDTSSQVVQAMCASCIFALEDIVDYLKKTPVFKDELEISNNKQVMLKDIYVALCSKDISYIFSQLLVSKKSLSSAIEQLI